jgi:hypothetical protein
VALYRPIGILGFGVCDVNERTSLGFSIPRSPMPPIVNSRQGWTFRHLSSLKLYGCGTRRISGFRDFSGHDSFICGKPKVSLFRLRIGSSPFRSVRGTRRPRSRSHKCRWNFIEEGSRNDRDLTNVASLPCPRSYPRHLQRFQVADSTRASTSDIYPQLNSVRDDSSGPSSIRASQIREFKVPKHHVPGIPDFPTRPNVDGLLRV